MEPSLVISSKIISLVSEIKDEIFSELDKNLHSFVSPSAYDTAWLALIPHDQEPKLDIINYCESPKPMFKNCLNWIIENQREGGFWGETDEDDMPTIDSLSATIACLLALKKWNVGYDHIEKGLGFIESKTEILLRINHPNFPRWFVVVFPAMIELAEADGLNLPLSKGLREMISHLSFKRKQLLQVEEFVESKYSPPLLSYFEALPSTHNCTESILGPHLNSDGCIFQSPSATAGAFMVTRNPESLKYLHSVLEKFPNGGVPAKYPVDENLVKLSLVDHIQRLGLADHFTHEIEHVLAQVYRNRKCPKSQPKQTNMMPVKLFQDALAFRLLRMQGHYVNPGSFCWFLREEKMLKYMEENCDEFLSAMYSVYRATDLQFPGETELEDARNFSIKLLRNSNHKIAISKGLQNMIKHELEVPWTARLDRLYHRKWIEENKISPLWIGKASFFRLYCLENKKLLQLAMENYEFQQLIYANELEELKRWSKKWGLSDLGFGRDKTTYTYYAVSATSCLPLNSIMRLIIAKSAIIVTVADDFYDEEGSLLELEALTDAVQRWNGEELQGPAKIIFQVLDDFVNDIVTKNYDHRERNRVVAQFRDIWRETFESWMVERTWSSTGYIPSMDEYLKTGMVSIAAHTIALPATNFFRHTSTNGTVLEHVQYQNITKLLMAISRLLNDTQSYQKERGQGKMNLVLLHSNENPGVPIEDSVAYVKEIIEEKTKEFLKNVFSDGFDDYYMSRTCKHVHLSCMRVFRMFFETGNLFDSKISLLEDIQKAIYVPIDHGRRLKSDSLIVHVPSNRKIQKISTGIQTMAKYEGIKRPFSVNRFGTGKVCIPLKFNVCFV